MGRTPHEHEVGIGVMQLQKKEHQGFPPNHQELGEGQGRDCPSQPSGGATRPTH